MIESQFHPADEIVRWGNTVHGLLSRTVAGGTVVLTVNGVDFPVSAPVFTGTMGDRYWAILADTFPFEERGSTHLMRVPGLAPLDLPPEEVAAAAAVGRTWQHYALLSGHGRSIYGKNLNGWICIDDAGDRWLVQPTGTPNANYGSANIASVMTLNFEVRPFGYLDEPTAAPVAISATLADIGQAGTALGGDPNVRMRLSSIASNGRQVVIGLYPLGTSITVDDMPSGWLLLTLAGPGPEFTATLTVLHTRTEALGNRVSSDSDARVRNIITLDMDNVVTGPDGSGNYTLTGTASGVSFTPTAGLSEWWTGSRTKTYEVQDRLCNVVFDDADALVRVTADITWSRTQTRGTPSMTDTTGELISTGDEEGMSDASGQLDIDIAWTSSDLLTIELQLKRDGVAMDTAVFTRSQDLSGVVHSIVGGPFQPPISSTLSPPEFNVPHQFVLPGTTFPIHYTFTVGGVAVHDVDAPGLYAIAEWTVPTWTTQAGILALMNTNTDGYTHAEYRIRRLCNHVVSGRWSLYRTVTGGAGYPGDQARTTRAIACQAEWDNPSGGSDPQTDIGASYHPYTHELYVRLAAEAGLDARRFVWI